VENLYEISSALYWAFFYHCVEKWYEISNNLYWALFTTVLNFFM